jgi:hypothetical protein
LRTGAKRLIDSSTIGDQVIKKQYHGCCITKSHPTEILATRHLSAMKRAISSDELASRTSGFVADGYDRLVDGLESKAREIVESKYAEEWNASGIVRRWVLQRQLDAEIAAIVAETMPDVSPDAMF